MDISNINQTIISFLTSKGVSPDLSAQTDLEKMNDLFQQMTTILQDSQNPQIISGITELLDRITPDIHHVAPRCSSIFQQTIEAAHRKLDSLSHQQELAATSSLEYLRSLPIEQLRLRSREDISKALGLDSWNDSGNIEVAKSKIIDCFTNKSVKLYLNKLNLTSIPNLSLDYFPNLTRLDLSGNRLTTLTIPESMSQLECLNLSENLLTTLTLPDSMDQLEYLILHINELSTLTLPASMNQLKHLYLEQNQLINIDLPASMNQLKILKLSMNELTTINLPTSMDQLRSLDLSYNQLTIRPNVSIYPRLEEIDLEGNLFRAIAPENTNPFNPLNPFIDKLLEGSSFKDFDDSPLRQNPVLFTQIHTWLDKLRTAADFKEGSKEMQGMFAERIFAILDLVIKEPSFQETFQAALTESLTSCVDRSTFFLNAMETNKILFEVKDAPLTTLSRVLKEIFTLEKINAFSANFIAQHRIQCDPDHMEQYDLNRVYQIDGISYVDRVDPIEVYLGLQNTFKEEFNLPIASTAMNYFACSRLKDRDLIEARNFLLDSLDNAIDVTNFMTSNDLWVKRIKEAYSEEIEEIAAPFQEALIEKMEETDYRKANLDEKKALLEPITTAKALTEKELIHAITLSLI